MDYKEKYKAAIERAKEELGSGCFNKGSIEYIFPELKKSEGEESKKWILEYLHDGLRKSDEQFKDHFRTAIAWLEKQGEKPITIGKRQLTGKAAELAKEVTPESLEETKKKMHLNDNSINVIIDSCGTNYVEESDWLINEYQNVLDEILEELHRHLDEALPEFDCRKPCPKKEEKI